MTGKQYIQVIVPLKLDWNPYYEAPAEGAHIGQRVQVRIGRNLVIGVVEAVDVTPPQDILPGIKRAEKPQDDLPDIFPEEIKLWEMVASYYLCTVGEVFKAAYPNAKLSNETAGVRKKTPASEENQPVLPTLTEAQKTALDEIHSAFSKKKPALLRGVTGSGKTEIYTHLAAECLSRGRNVLYLVSGIAGSRQLEDRLKLAFGERLLVFHSRETLARRGAITRALREGRGPFIVLGTRSSLFLPWHDLGLVIVDEEQDSAYKQDSPSPRYNGRNVALMLSSIHHGCNILLGSATPSLESIYNARISGKYVPVELAERYYKGDDASVTLVDTVAEKKKNGMVGSFSRILIGKIREALSSGSQVMIMAPWHDGVESFAAEAGTLFPDARICTLDSVVALRKGHAEEKTIKAFAKGEYDIIIGTEMISGEFDFSRVSLTAVMRAEFFLSRGDFRDDEKSYQLFEQFRGRCSRRGGPGELVIQSARSSHPVCQKFLLGESYPLEDTLLAERALLGLPPYTRLVDIIIEDSAPRRLAFQLDILSNTLTNNGFSFMGPFSLGQDGDRQSFRIAFPRTSAAIKDKARLKALIDAHINTNKYQGHITINVDPD